MVQLWSVMHTETGNNYAIQTGNNYAIQTGNNYAIQTNIEKEIFTQSVNGNY